MLAIHPTTKVRGLSCFSYCNMWNGVKNVAGGVADLAKASGNASTVTTATSKT